MKYIGRTTLYLLIGLCVTFTGCTFRAPVFGLSPEYPGNLHSFLDKKNVYVEIGSLTPTLRWESFPRIMDVQADKEGIMGRIKDVAYDLKIWRSEDDFPVFLIYSGEGLPDPFYKVENLLEPCTKYLWTVRARFELDGQTRVTEWGVSKIPWRNPWIRWVPQVPEPNLYRFKTPCVKTPDMTNESPIEH